MMASGALPQHLAIHNTSATDGSQTFAGLNLGTINYSKSDNSSYLNNVLKTLPVAAEAPFDSYRRQYDPTCLQDTRVDLLQQIYNWAKGQNSPSIFWLSGLAGTGKSTVARTVATEYSERGRLAGSFFFSRGGGDVGNARKFVTTIAAQLAYKVEGLKQTIGDAISQHGDIASLSLRDQWRHLVLGPLTTLDSKESWSYILVVDALDECDDGQNVQTILQLFSEVQSLETVRLRLFLTSRPEVPIRQGFIQMADAKHQDFILHNIVAPVVDHDIGIFFQDRLRVIRQECRLGADWPSDQDVAKLIRNANGLFIWAATACRFILEGRSFAVDRLFIILKDDHTGYSTDDSSADDDLGDTAALPDEHLDSLYITVLRSSTRKLRRQEKRIWLEFLRITVGTIVILLSPLSTRSLSKLLAIPEEEVDRRLSDVHAILDIPEDPTCPLHLHHPSFRDFLLDKKRCGDSDFWVEQKQAHQTLATKCIQLMSISLRQDICGVERPGACVDEVESAHIESSLLPEVQYACLYWTQHLQKSESQLTDNDQVHQFLQEHLLHWIEALGWMGKLSDAVYAIISLEAMIEPHTSPRLYEYVHDMKRLLLYNKVAIEVSPLQIYCSALVFAPQKSLVRRQFLKSCLPSWIRILPKVEENWNALLQTLEGHSIPVTDVTFSPDGRQLASVSFDCILLWDVGSGTVLQRLGSHSDRFTTIAFSPNGRLLASASDAGTLKLWSAGSGALLKTHEGHSKDVTALAFSPDGKRLASASFDKTVKLWDTTSGVLLRTLRGYSDSLQAGAVAFSPDGKLLASASSRWTVILCDAGSGKKLRALEVSLDNGSPGARAIAFSPDSKAIASLSGSIHMWDVHSGAVLRRFCDSWGSQAVAFSANGRMLGSATWYKIVKLWDTGSGELLRTFEGHSDSALGIAFSPDSKLVASASRDCTVKLWDASSKTKDQTTSPITAVVFSPDGKLLASASEGGAVKLWDPSSGRPLQTFQDNSEQNGPEVIAFSPDGQLLASADWTIKLWDLSLGSVLQTWKPSAEWGEGRKSHSAPVSITVFSPSSKLLASGCAISVKLWKVESAELLHTFENGPADIHAVSFSLDGELLALASREGNVYLWGTSSGMTLHTLGHGYGCIQAIAFSPDGKCLASASRDDYDVLIWNTRSGLTLRTLRGHDYSPCAVAFSQDSKLVASVAYDYTVKLWDNRSGEMLKTLDIGTVVENLSFIDNNTLMTSRGKIKLPGSSDDRVHSRRTLSRNVLVRSQWIAIGNQDVLWLPPDYRPTGTTGIAVYGSIVVLGHLSGRITFMEFAPRKYP